MSAMTVRTVQENGFKKARVYYFCASVCRSRETFFSEFELENSPYKFSSSDNKLVKSVWKIQYTEETTNKRQILSLLSELFSFPLLFTQT